MRLPLLALSCVLLGACGDSCMPTPPRLPNDPYRVGPYVDDWKLVAEGSADTLRFLSIGDRPTMDNFANRGDIEVIFDPAATMVKIEMQRFTIASGAELAEAAFGRMENWAFNSASPERLDPETDPDAAALVCFTGDNDACYVRAYYDGQIQPARDGANFRVTLPAGWDGALELTTSDNIFDGVESYPDRSDITVTGLAGTLLVDLDSGNVEIELDPAIDHYAGCPANDACEQGDGDMLPFDPACGCTDPTFVRIENGPGQASNITIDVPLLSAVNGEPRWYDVKLENEGSFSGSDEFVCQATIDCESFGAGCEIDAAYPQEYRERAAINFPDNGATVPGTGIQILATSKDCSNIPYLDDPLDYELEEFPEEQRGNLRVCSGCL